MISQIYLEQILEKQKHTYNKQINKLFKDGTPYKFSKNEILLRHNEKGENLFLIKEGIIKETRVSKQEDECILRFVFPGEIAFSPIGFLGRMASSSIISAVTNGWLIKIKSSDLLSKISNNDKDLKSFLWLLSIHIEQTESMILNANRGPLKARLMWLLEKQPHAISKIPLKHLAKYLDVRIETLSRQRTYSSKQNTL